MRLDQRLLRLPVVMAAPADRRAVVHVRPAMAPRAETDGGDPGIGAAEANRAHGGRFYDGADMACVFCTDVRRAGEVLAEDDRLWIVLHADWAVRGHTMVIWKKHVENVADLTVDEFVHFAVEYHRAERAILAATGADRAVILN